jgi:hypothetical protein
VAFTIGSSCPKSLVSAVARQQYLVIVDGGLHVVPAPGRESAFITYESGSFVFGCRAD